MTKTEKTKKQNEKIEMPEASATILSFIYLLIIESNSID